MNLAALQHSPLLHSLGWAIASSLWQTAILWIGYFLINSIYKNSSANFKTNVGTILLFTSFAWFCFTLFDKYFFILHQSAVVKFSAVNNLKNSFTISAFFLNQINAVLPYLSVAYLLLLTFLLFRLLASYNYTRFIKLKGLQNPPAQWKSFAEKVAIQMGIAKKIKIWISHHIDVPATIGFIKPVILIPIASINQLSAEQLEAIILHELSHIKRNDYLINIFVSLVETMLFFNPFVVLLSKIIKKERENCCDDFVIQYQYDRYSYASALLSLEHSRNIHLRLAISATSGKKQLLHRIKRIMEVNNNRTFNYGQKILALLFITGTICSIAWLSPKKEENENVAVTKNFTSIINKKINAFAKSSIAPSKKNIIKPNDFNVIKNEKEKPINVNVPKVSTNEPEMQAGDEYLQTINDNENIISEKIAEKKINILSAKLKNASGSPLFMEDSNFLSAKSKSKSYSFNFNTKKFNNGLIDKLQNQMQNINLKYSFDYELMQKEIKRALIDIEKNMVDEDLFKSINNTETVKLIREQIKNSESQMYTKLASHLHQLANTQAKFNIHPGFSFNSILSKTTKLKNNQIAELKEMDKIQQNRRYIITPAHAGNEKNSARTYNSFKSFTHTNCNPEIIINNSSEVSNGTMIINGKPIKLPGTDKIIAQAKTKKVVIRSVNNFVEIHIDN